MKLNGGRHVQGILRGFDPFMNLVVDDCLEMGPGGQQNTIGMVVSTFVFLNFLYCHQRPWTHSFCSFFSLCIQPKKSCALKISTALLSSSSLLSSQLQLVYLRESSGYNGVRLHICHGLNMLQSTPIKTPIFLDSFSCSILTRLPIFICTWTLCILAHSVSAAVQIEICTISLQNKINNFVLFHRHLARPW